MNRTPRIVAGGSIGINCSSVSRKYKASAFAAGCRAWISTFSRTHAECILGKWASTKTLASAGEADSKSIEAR